MGVPELTDHDIRKLTRITGLEVHQDRTGIYGRDPEFEQAVVSIGPSLSADDFLRANLDRLRRQLLAEQVWRCAQCGGIKPLQLHHRKHRSEQRDDRIENLEMLCATDHGKEHGG